MNLLFTPESESLHDFFQYCFNLFDWLCLDWTLVSGLLIFPASFLTWLPPLPLLASDRLFMSTIFGGTVDSLLEFWLAVSAELLRILTGLSKLDIDINGMESFDCVSGWKIFLSLLFMTLNLWGNIYAINHIYTN